MTNNTDPKSAEAAVMEAKGRKAKVACMAVASAVLCVAAALLAAKLLAPAPPANEAVPSTTGMELVEVPEGMSDEEVQAMLDEMARESTMDVAIGSVLTLDGDELTVSFQNDQSNKSAQRFVLEQDGDTVFVSGPVEPGYELEKVRLTASQASSLHEGAATATVTSVTDDGEPVGNGAKIDVRVAVG